METAFGWIGRILEFFINLFPLLTIVKPTHAGIAFVRGNNVKVLHHDNGWWFPNFKLFSWPRPRLWFTRDYWAVRTGLHVTWPFWTEVVTYPIVRQTINLPPQTLMTRDMKSVVMSSIIIYEIVDIEKILVHTYEPETVIRDVAMAAIKRVVLSQDFDKLLRESKKIDQQLTLVVRKSLAERFGVRVIKVMFTDLTPARSYRLWGNPPAYEGMEEE
jgi:regulator of protease activity HflC (stomatin/prohibitin superfamily)